MEKKEDNFQFTFNRKWLNNGMMVLVIPVVFFLFQALYTGFLETDESVSKKIDQVDVKITEVINNQTIYNNQLENLKKEVERNSNGINDLTALVAKNYEKDREFQIQMTEDLNAYKLEREKATKIFYQETLPDMLDKYFEKRR